METLFELECKSYELLARRFDQLKSYRGTSQAMDGDDKKIRIVHREMLKLQADMIAYYGKMAEAYFQERAKR